MASSHGALLCNTWICSLRMDSKYRENFVHSKFRIRASNDLVLPNQPESMTLVFSNSESKNSMSDARPLISFPGGGVFFYWQMGAISAIKKRYNLKNVDFSGASAGALSATLAACQVDALEAAELAYQLSIENNIWNRTTGLGGIWGKLIREWLQILLPEDCAEICSKNVHVCVLCLPSISRRKWNFNRMAINDFKSKDDLIECCMSSVHIPFFLNGEVFMNFRNMKTIDGSIFATRDSISLGAQRPILYLDYIDDEEMKKKRFQFLSLGAEGEGPSRSWQWLMEMMKQGEMFAERMHEEGKLHFLEPIQ